MRALAGVLLAALIVAVAACAPITKGPRSLDDVLRRAIDSNEGEHINR